MEGTKHGVVANSQKDLFRTRDLDPAGTGLDFVGLAPARGKDDRMVDFIRGKGTGRQGRPVNVIRDDHEICSHEDDVFEWVGDIRTGPEIEIHDDCPRSVDGEVERDCRISAMAVLDP